MNVVIVPSLGAFGAGEHFLSAKRRQDFGAYFHNKEVGGKIKKEKRKKKSPTNPVLCCTAHSLFTE